jgi:hypothetical protein
MRTSVTDLAPFFSRVLLATDFSEASQRLFRLLSVSARHSTQDSRSCMSSRQQFLWKQKDSFWNWTSIKGIKALSVVFAKRLNEQC